MKYYIETLHSGTMEFKGNFDRDFLDTIDEEKSFRLVHV